MRRILSILPFDKRLESFVANCKRDLFGGEKNRPRQMRCLGCSTKNADTPKGDWKNRAVSETPLHSSEIYGYLFPYYSVGSKRREEVSLARRRCA